MTRKKAAAVLHLLIAGERDYYLVKDRPNVVTNPNGSGVIARLPKRKIKK